MIEKNFHDLLGRFKGIAVIDVVGTIGIAVYIAKYYNLNIFTTVFLFLLLGHSVHLYLNIDTELVKKFRRM